MNALQQLRSQIAVRLCESIVRRSDVNLDGLDYATADVRQVLDEFGPLAHRIADADWRRFIHLVHKDLHRRGLVTTRWNEHKPDILVHAFDLYLRELRAKGRAEPAPAA